MHFNLILLVVCILICEAAGAVGGVFTVFARNPWLKAQRKSIINPPDWAMGPLWAGFYTLMGIALYLVWRLPSDTPNRTVALALFAVQLVLNVLWYILLFKAKHPFIAYIDLMVVWIVLLDTTITFGCLLPVCFFLLVPAWIWVSFEAYLNFAMVSLNDEPVATRHP